ncbi:hypothetical protein MM1S1540310_0363 [Mycobacteroides abscessus subsp. bolletii 1S-154-0310]|nr:hypothetical protein MM1S1510930_5793 [Mycobacteroides abscessus subsp. bolletii 1S-151-0930]EIU67228.1 hypothetical protein MM1S1520914_1013 [Mycobacteroides abscessus subsp. bolletii 1S-152-0914]EIU82804.1 hypothetical protein MM1S1530915_0348 [Mycobacteroides abscessus subsp. bolletii 1S-153-0915]EIU83787.1 hypothetical protein MM1S1540310_0363 [Mycobacteroides abscessus subsp. bolletii 1S-154-0310]
MSRWWYPLIVRARGVQHLRLAVGGDDVECWYWVAGFSDDNLPL